VHIFEKLCLTVPLLLLLSGSPACANLIINATFDSATFSTLSQSDRTATQNTINSVIQAYQNEILNSITVNISFKVDQSVLGSTLFTAYAVPYDTFRTNLTSHAVSADDFTALAHLAVGTTLDPVTSQNKIEVKGPLARALALGNFQADNANSDGTISLGTNSMNLSRTGTQVGTKYDLQSVASHEINEVLGLGSSMGVGFPFVSPEDLFRYHGTSSTCAAVSGRSYTSSAAETSCFSIDGSTGLARFNQSSSGDYGDWSSVNGSPKVQDEFATPGTQANNGIEWKALDVLGYNLAPAAVPEPATGALFAVTLGLAVFWRRKRTV
jgi:hypothetical protein